MKAGGTMMRLNFFYIVFFAAFATNVLAQSPGEFALDQGFVKFNAPSDWPVIMQKIEGNPQFIAFQVKDPADSGTQDATRITGETKLLDDSGNFQAMVNVGVDKAKQSPGYEPRTDNADASTLLYFALNGKTRYEYRETWYLNGHVMVHARCARPMLAATTKEWVTEYEKGCAQIMQSLKPH
jgi:hypothetical protein